MSIEITHAEILEQMLIEIAEKEEPEPTVIEPIEKDMKPFCRLRLSMPKAPSSYIWEKMPKRLRLTQPKPPPGHKNTATPPRETIEADIPPLTPSKKPAPRPLHSSSRPSARQPKRLQARITIATDKIHYLRSHAPSPSPNLPVVSNAREAARIIRAEAPSPSPQPAPRKRKRSTAPSPSPAVVSNYCLRNRNTGSSTPPSSDPDTTSTQTTTATSTSAQSQSTDNVGTQNSGQWAALMAPENRDVSEEQLREYGYSAAEFLAAQTLGAMNGGSGDTV